MFARDDSAWFVDGVLFIGRGVRIAPREGRLLSYLVLHKGEECLSEALATAVWDEPEKWPQLWEDALERLVWQIRKAIPRRLVFIQTLTKPNGKGHRLVGYRLSGPIGVKQVQE